MKEFLLDHFVSETKDACTAFISETFGTDAEVYGTTYMSASQIRAFIKSGDKYYKLWETNAGSKLIEVGTTEFYTQDIDGLPDIKAYTKTKYGTVLYIIEFIPGEYVDTYDEENLEAIKDVVSDVMDSVDKLLSDELLSEIQAETRHKIATKLAIDPNVSSDLLYDILNTFDTRYDITDMGCSYRYLFTNNLVKDSSGNIVLIDLDNFKLTMKQLVGIGNDLHVVGDNKNEAKLRYATALMKYVHTIIPKTTAVGIDPKNFF